MTESDLPVGTNDPSLRSCGTCYACCKWLGIEALRKYPGQMCKHATQWETPHARCQVYTARPNACATYSCAWLEGLGTDVMRPDLSGILVSIYGPNPETPDTPLSATLTITDFERAGTTEQGNIKDFTEALLNYGFTDLRIVDFVSKTLVHIKDGLVYRGRLTKQDGYESLNFETFNPPIGRYETKVAEKDDA